MTDLSIIPECYVDTKVAEIVCQPRKKYNHQHGCGDVARTLLKLKNAICLGIIDEDKNKGPRAKYLDEFKTVREESNLILQRHPQFKQYLVLICPEIEQWLMNDANAVNIKPVDFELPDNLKDFTSLSKTRDIDKNEGFYRFIKSLLREKAPSISTLKVWLELFQSNKLDEFL
jgi:hypothetical protein